MPEHPAPTAVPPPDGHHVEVRRLSKRFGGLLVLDDISFTVRRGEFLCLVGPTGCGKTTFTNTLSRLIPPSSGDILIDGEEADPRRHNLAYVLQEPTSLPWRTVRDNVACGMEYKRLPRTEIAARLERILELVGLVDCADLYPNQISASMEQRIAVARAFATQPDLLLMDEPYGQLDVKLRFYLEDELVRIWQHMGTTVLFITHNIEEAVYLAERILVLGNKPTRIKADIQVNLDRPRDYLDPAFIHLKEEVVAMIKWW